MATARERMRATAAPEWRDVMREAARERRRQVEQAAEESAALPDSIGDFIVKRTGGRWSAPTHLVQLTDLLEAALDRPFKAIVSIPPQHAKTETILHGLALLIARDPWRTNGYASYATELSKSKSEKCRGYAIGLGVKINPNANKQEEWRTTDGGGLLATGVGGPLTGQGVDGVLVVDDPVKNREEANSAVYRRKTRAWFDTVATTRVHPQTSMIVCLTRWHPHDLAGSLIAEGWADVVISIPGVTGQTGFDPGQRSVTDGSWERRPRFLGPAKALWPEARNLAFLAEQRRTMGPDEFAALYDQDPRPPGGQIFDPPRLCDYADVPSIGRDAIGVDLAYTAKTTSDWSGYLTLRRVGEVYYVVKVERRQQRTPESQAMLRAAAAMHPGAPMVWHASGTELGSADLMVEGGVPLQAKTAIGDKVQRSQRVAVAWNNGDVIVPRDAPWSADFIREVTEFTGVDGSHDDQVDMLATAHGELCSDGVEVDTGGHQRAMANARAAY